MHRRHLGLWVALLAIYSGGCRSNTGQGSTEKVKGVPEWIPVYAGAKVSDVQQKDAGVEHYTEFRMDIAADCRDVFTWYDDRFKLAGFDNGKSVGVTGGCDGILRAEGAGNTRSVRISGGGTPGRNGPSSFSVLAVERNLGGKTGSSAAGAELSWIPQYPGSKPANIVTRDEGGERSVDFSYATGDDAQKVIGWYEENLKRAQFTIVTQTVFDSSTAKLVAQDQAGRLILNIRMEPAGGQNVVAISMRKGVQ